MKEGHEALIILQTPQDTKNFFYNVDGRVLGETFAIVQADVDRRYRDTPVLTTVYPCVPIQLQLENIKLDSIIPCTPKASNCPYKTFSIEVSDNYLPECDEVLSNCYFII